MGDIIQFEGLNSTEWWFLRSQIENVNVEATNHRMVDDVYVITLSVYGDSEEYDLYLDTAKENLAGILHPFKVVKLCGHQT
jgi:hypothetical protein